MSKIVQREIIKLNPFQEKMVISGWGERVLADTIVEKITYISDGLKVKGYIAYPKENSGKRYPCIIWNRGGYGERGAIDQFTARGIFGLTASWGYVVFASQYRGNAGGEGKEELGGEDVNDILNLKVLAEEIPFADNSTWGIEGWSRGGMMTCLALIKNPSFKCAVLSGAVSDMKSYAESLTTLYNSYKEIMGADNLDKKLTERTILNYVHRLPHIPYLIMHGGADETISPMQSLRLSEKMHENKIDHRLVIFEGGDHYLKNHRKESDALRKEWYSRYLKASS